MVRATVEPTRPASSRQYIKITSRPDGEAPEWVRDAWAGLYLPLKDESAGMYWTVGVLTWAQRYSRLLFGLPVKRQWMLGFRVDAKQAVDLLAQHNANAASWWRQNIPNTTIPGRSLVFQASACLLAESAASVMELVD